jgi:hypothetical protein
MLTAKKKDSIQNALISHYQVLISGLEPATFWYEPNG